MSNILITGGLGFIGSHTSLDLLNNGHKVVIVDSLINSSETVFHKIHKLFGYSKHYKSENLYFREGDLRNESFLREVFEEFKSKESPIDSVIHFAGLKSVFDSIMNPLYYWDANLKSTINLLNSMEDYECRKVVFSSSATIYKPSLNKLISESSECIPINPYGNTKLGIETLLNDIFKSKPNKWKIACLRYFNPVGAHETGELGEDPKDTPNNLFPILMNVALRNQDYLHVYGNDWPTSDGTCVRDYIHVMDLAGAHLAALDYLDNSPSKVLNLNIGTGIGKSILEVIETFKKVNNCDLPYKFASRRDGDAPFVVADNSLALSTINWKPIKKLEDMCRDSWRYAKMQLSR